MSEMLTDMDTTSTFIDFMIKFPFEFQSRVTSLIDWNEYPIESLLQLILDGSSLLKSTLAKKLFNIVEWDLDSIKLGLGSDIQHVSDEFELLLKVIEHIRSQTNMQSTYVIETLKLLSYTLDDDIRFKAMFDNTKYLEIVDFLVVASLISLNIDYLKKIRRCTISDPESTDLDELGLVLNQNIEFLEIRSIQYEEEDLILIENIFEKLKSFQLEQKNLKINLIVEGESIGTLDFDSLPSLRIPNLDITLIIKSTRHLKAGELERYIRESFDLKNISHLYIQFSSDTTTDEYLKDVSFIGHLNNLKVLKLAGDFRLELNSRSLVLNLDELYLANGYVNLSNIIAKKMTLKLCELPRNTISEGVEELIEESSLDWDQAKLPSTLTELEIDDSLDEISFDNNIDVFKNLTNLKKLTISDFIKSANLSFPPNLHYLEIGSYFGHPSDELEFDFPESLRTLVVHELAVDYVMNMEKFPTNLETLILYFDVVQNDIELMFPKSGVKILTLYRVDSGHNDDDDDSEMDDDNEILILKLSNIERLVEINVLGNLTRSVEVIVPDNEKKYLSNINIVCDEFEI
ncbi:hypothetical protein CANARDRAFT_25934 [[Candida] arabinofermentans NRRL YB-2248]|uniref:F-box domain-containing protein n=1 Tax=[Candida] arabinofermentans NRRL YB-2248 TaxID=983967 RepID=A0A1E4T7K8_9ASCO|nr:hypothetical protein CANARDRAFT_25934 [[Candida] arabinofermentans NRRL YB-2248]